MDNQLFSSSININVYLDIRFKLNMFKITGLPVSMYTTKTPIAKCRFNVTQLKEFVYIFCKRQISIKLFYLYQKLQCTDNYFFKIKFVLFLYLLLSASWKKNDVLPFWICNQSATSRSQKNPIKGKSVFKIPNPSSPIICQ